MMTRHEMGNLFFSGGASTRYVVLAVRQPMIWQIFVFYATCKSQITLCTMHYGEFLQCSEMYVPTISTTFSLY